MSTETQAEALTRAVTGQSLMNYADIYRGWRSGATFVRASTGLSY